MLLTKQKTRKLRAMKGQLVELLKLRGATNRKLTTLKSNIDKLEPTKFTLLLQLSVKDQNNWIDGKLEDSITNLLRKVTR